MSASCPRPDPAWPPAKLSHAGRQRPAHQAAREQHSHTSSTAMSEDQPGTPGSASLAQ